MKTVKAWLIKDYDGKFWDQLFYSERICKKAVDDSNDFEFDESRMVKMVPVEIREVEHDKD